jgi:hypothetical protein
MRLKSSLFLIFFFTFFASANDLAEAYKRTSKSVVFVEAIDKNGKVKGYGSGFYIHDGHRVVTNYHVISDATYLQITDINNYKHIVELVSYISNKNDLAVLQLSHQGKPLEFSNMEGKVGDDVFTVGSPKGFKNSLSTGIISSFRYDKSRKLIQTTTPISSGSSGGPLMNIDGKVIGVTTFIIKDTQNINFAVPILELVNEIEFRSNKIQSSQAHKNTVNLADPEEVALAFYKMMQKKKYELMNNYVHPEDQNGFSKATNGGLEIHDFGDDIFATSKYTGYSGKIKNLLNIEVKIDYKLGEDDGNGKIDFRGLFNDVEVGFDMVKEYGRWLIVK